MRVGVVLTLSCLLLTISSANVPAPMVVNLHPLRLPSSPSLWADGDLHIKATPENGPETVIYLRQIISLRSAGSRTHRYKCMNIHIYIYTYTHVYTHIGKICGCIYVCMNTHK